MLTTVLPYISGDKSSLEIDELFDISGREGSSFSCCVMQVFLYLAPSREPHGYPFIILVYAKSPLGPPFDQYPCCWEGDERNSPLPQTDGCTVAEPQECRKNWKKDQFWRFKIYNGRG